MKGVLFLGDRQLELREFPDPTPGPRDVILELKASGRCMRRRVYLPNSTAGSHVASGGNAMTAPSMSSPSTT